MPVYRSTDPNTEIIGAAILGSLNVMDAEHVRPLLGKHGLGNIQPNVWYPLSLWLDFLTELSDYQGAMFNFVAIGTKTVEKAIEFTPIPPEAAAFPFEMRMQMVNQSYQMQIRNGDAGELRIEMVGEKHFKITDTTPYPSDLIYGVLWGTTRVNLPPGVHFVLSYDEALPLKEEGSPCTVIDLTWE